MGPHVTGCLRWAVMLLALVAGTGEAGAGVKVVKAPTVIDFEVHGRVTALQDDVATINRGLDDGLTAGRDDLVFYPLRQGTGETSKSIDALVILASGRVQSISADSAQVRLERKTDEVRVGDLFSYKLQVPAVLDDDPLTRVAAMDVQLRSLDSDKPMYTLAERIRDPSPAAGTAIYERLIAEVRAQVELADAAFTKPIPGGRFHGQQLSEAFQRTSAADLEEFLLFIDEYPGKYIGQTWKLVEVYATWIINRTPSGQDKRLERRVAPLVAEGEALSRAGKLDQAEQVFREVLRQHPASSVAKKTVASIDQIEDLRRALRRDPADQTVRYDLMVAYGEVEAWPLVLQEALTLAKTDFRAHRVAYWRGVALSELGKYDEAIKVFEKIKLPEDDKTWGPATARKLQEARIRKASGAKVGSTRSFREWVDLAQAEEKAGEFESAQKKLYMARKVAVNVDELQQVGVAASRLVELRSMVSVCETLKTTVGDHNLDKMEDRIAAVVKLARAHKVETVALKCLDKASERARDKDEYAAALRIDTVRTELAPTVASVWRDLGWTAFGAQDLALAEKATRQALQMDDNSAFGHHLLGLVLLARGDLDGAEAEAKKSCNNATYEWPRRTLARIATARGQHDAAVAMALEARKLADDPASMALGLRGVVYARDAARAIAAGTDVARQRLRLLRALVQLGLWNRVGEELDALKGTANYDDACWAVAETEDTEAPVALRLRAARDGKAESPRQKALLERITAESDLTTAGATPVGEGARLRLARLLVKEGRFHLAIATVGPVTQKASSDAVERQAQDISDAAHKGLDADDLVAQADEVRERGGGDAQTEKLYGEAARRFEAIEAWGRASMAAFYRAWALAMQGRSEEALQAITALEPRLRGNVPALVMIDIAMVKAGVLSWRGNLDANAKAVAESMETCRTLDEDRCVHNMLLQRSSLMVSEGRLAEAIADASQVLEFAKALGFDEQARRALFQVGDISLVAGDLVKAQQVAVELLDASRKAKDAGNERYALMLHGAVAARRGDAPAALGWFADVFRVGERTGDNGVKAMAKLFEGFTHLDASHEPKKALPAFEAATQFFDKAGDDYNVARSRHGTGRARLELGQADAARTVLEAVLAFATKVGRQTLVAAAHVELCHVELLAGRKPEALAHAQAAVAIAEKTDIDSDRWAALHALGRALDAAGQAEQAAEKLREAAKTLAREIGRSGGEEQQQGATGYGRSRKVFKDAIDVFIRLGRTNEALEILQLSRDAALRRMFKGVRPEVSDAAAGKALDVVQSASEQAEAARRALEAEKAKPDAERSEARIQALGERVAANVQQLNQLLFQLKSNHPRLYSLAANVADPRTLVADRDVLAKDTMIVAYFLAGDVLYIFTIAPGRKDAHAFKVELGDIDLRQTVEEWREAVKKRTPKVAVLGRKLYDKLLAPVEVDIAQAKTLLIVPSGPLFFLPFGALETKVGTKSVYAVEKWRIATLMSTTMGSLHRPRPKGRWGSMAAFANPDGSLPGAQAEVEKVRDAVFRDAKLFVGAKAIEEAVRGAVGQNRILHFATHGILSPDRLASHLQMAAGPLTVNAIAGLPFGETTDLAVLSACETAVSMGETAEEGISIAEAFAFGGVQTLVASLWSVPDDATSELMVRFYRNLRAGKGDTVDALRTAQLDLLKLDMSGRKPFSQPIHWAAFGVIGDYR